MNMKHFYLAAAITGAIIPYLFFITFFNSEGLLPTTFIGGVFANGAAGGFTADLLISSFVFWAYLINQNTKQIWLYVLVNMTIGLSCALPLYLYRQALEQDTTEAAASPQP